MADAIFFLGLVVGVPALLMTFAYLQNKQKHEERLRMIEKGITPPPVVAAGGEGIWLRRSAIVLMMFGIALSAALLIAAIVNGEKKILALSGVGLIPFFIGAGLLADEAMRRRKG